MAKIPYSKMTLSEQKRISKKIQKLIREGYSVNQAAAIAYSMERKHKLGPRGGKKNPRTMGLSDEAFREIFDYLEVVNPNGGGSGSGFDGMPAKKNPFDDPAIARTLSYLLYLRQHPDKHKNIPDSAMKIFVNQNLFDMKKMKLTTKAEKILADAIASMFKKE